jgi:predicted MFS family arabinose efflux permease
VFWVDYLARELDLGATYSSTQWAIFGVGAVAGPLCASLCATRWGWWATTTGAYALKALAIGLPLVWVGFAGHAVSGFIVGALSPGMAAITSGYLMQLIGPARHKRMWGYATAAFALLQATAGYVMATIYATTGSYRSLFLMGCLALCMGAVLVAFSKPKTTAAVAA